MIVAWTYLLHAYYRKLGMNYRYMTSGEKSRLYQRTKHGAYKYWELERCLDAPECPLEAEVVQNLKFLIGLRHEIEHQMTTRIDDLLSARFQACCINYDAAIKTLFGEKYGIAQDLSFSLQFSSFSHEQVKTLEEQPGLPQHIKTYIEGFDGALPADHFASEKFAYRVIFVPKTVNHLNQADQVITFVKSDSELAKSLNATYSVIRETERPKWLPSQIVAKMRDDGYPRFSISQHAYLWRELDAKNPSKGYGTQLAKIWYWYDTWVSVVREHCAANADYYR